VHFDEPSELSKWQLLEGTSFCEATLRQGLQAFSVTSVELIGRVRLLLVNGDVIVISSNETRLDDESWEEVSTLKLSREAGVNSLAGAIA
jgi:hypothetical protein